MDLNVVNTTLQTIAKSISEIKNNVTNYYTTQSLAEATKLTRVEPLTIFSKDCLSLEIMPDVAQSLLSIFAGYYLQAVSILTKVNDVEVVRILDKLNPDRDETGFLLSEQVGRESLSNLCLESYEFSLPHQRVISMEQDKDTVTHLMEMSNLSVGKLLNLEICYTKQTHGIDSEDRTVKVPVSIRLMSSVIPNASINHILTYKSEDNSLLERFHSWRSGRIGFIKDLIFCQDLIDEYKKANISDESNTLQEIIRRVNNAKKYGLLTKNPSLVSASNIFVITEEVAREVESKLGGKLSNSKIRQKAFDNTYAMIIAVVDREWERVTFYTRGMAAATDLSFKEIKSAAKGKGPDILDLMKSFNQGLPVSF
jgi:hypothetical protein